MPDTGSPGGGDGELVAVAAGGGEVGPGGAELDVVSGNVVSGGGLVVGAGDGGFEVVTSGGDGVTDGGAGDADVVKVGGSGSAAAGGGAATTGTSGTVGRPPFPFVPGGTGPGADGVGTTPVRYAWAHCSTMST